MEKENYSENVQEIGIKNEPSLINVIETKNNPQNNPDEITKSSKKEKEKKEKKANKKLAKAINVLKFHEGVEGIEGGELHAENPQKPQREIFSGVPTPNLWIYHFGNGDEDDQKGIKDFLTTNYGECKVYMFPGISYGYIELQNTEQALKVIPEEQDGTPSINKSTTNKNSNPINIKPSYKYNCLNIKFNTGERKVYVFYSQIPLDYVNENNNSTFPIAKKRIYIPGLYLFDDFITEEEEKHLLEDVDKQEWNKLSNRRVQHYGFEFIYGANNVNKNNKIGELPEFCDGLKIKFEELLKKFIKRENDVAEIYEYKDEENLNNLNKEKINAGVENVGMENSGIENISVQNKSFFDNFGNFDQLTINDYNPGEGIPPHVDSHSPFEDVFCALSIASGVVMTFLSPNDELQHVYLQPRRLVVFTGESRYIYQHSISLRKLDRVEDNIIFRKRRLSLTFRKIRKGECHCPYIKFCDSQKHKLTQVTPSEDFKIEINKPLVEGEKNIDDLIFKTSLNKPESENTKPTEIEKIHVYDVYEKIAPHFSHTRYKPWPKVAEYLNNLPPGCLNADVGCGNGKYLNVNEKIFTIGTDRSFNLVKICREKNNNNQVFVADSLKLPLRSNAFDSAISIAVVHHFSNVELRLTAITELIRILKPEGTLLIYVWALEQEGKKFNQQDNFVPWHLQNTYENEKHIETLGPEIIKEEKKNATVYHRYYHMFKQGELEGVIKKLPNVSILESYYDHANWCCIVKKEF